MNQKEPVDGQQATVAGLSGQSKAHLCAASNIRAMPETEIPPAMRGDFYFAYIKVQQHCRLQTRA